MPAIQSKANKVTKTKSEVDIMSDATLRLLKGIKDHAISTGKSLTREELLRRGYDKEFIAKLEAA